MSSKGQERKRLSKPIAASCPQGEVSQRRPGGPAWGCAHHCLQPQTLGIHAEKCKTSRLSKPTAASCPQGEVSQRRPGEPARGVLIMAMFLTPKKSASTATVPLLKSQ